MNLDGFNSPLVPGIRVAGMAEKMCYYAQMACLRGAGDSSRSAARFPADTVWGYRVVGVRTDAGLQQ